MNHTSEFLESLEEFGKLKSPEKFRKVLEISLNLKDEKLVSFLQNNRNLGISKKDYDSYKNIYNLVEAYIVAMGCSYMVKRGLVMTDWIFS